MRSLLPAIQVAAFASFVSVTSRVKRKTALLLFSIAVAVAATPTPTRAASAFAQVSQKNSAVQVGQSYHNDISPALRDLPVFLPSKERKDGDEEEMPTGNLHPQMPIPLHTDIPDPVIDHGLLGLLVPEVMPSPILNFDGIPFTGFIPPDTGGAVGLTQYVQIVNLSYQVFNKTNGGSVLGPLAITAIWAGFGGVCQNNGDGDPVVLYDHIANRWLISQFAGTSTPTDACIAVSTTSDATGAWNRYAFHLGSNLFIDPKLSIWPDGYYMSVKAFNSGGTVFLGPQAFAFDRAKMLEGMPPSVITPGIAGGPNEGPFLSADLDGSILPPSGAPNSFVGFPGAGVYKIWHFHVDFTTPANSTFTLFASPPAAPFTLLCPGPTNCVPQGGTTTTLDGVGNRLMFRLAYRNFGSPSVPNESIVGNYSVSSSGVAGVRWFELKNVTSGPVTVAQESTYQPDTTWRWLGSAAMDHAGNFAIGFSASSSSINPQVRYAGRLATDPPNTLAQGEAHLFDGTGSQVGGGAWGRHSQMTIDPVDDCTFWYTNEYYATSTFNWRTRIGNFKFAQCDGSVTPTPTPTPTLTPTPTGTPSPTPTATATAPTSTPTPTPFFVRVFWEGFDAVTTPALPASWVTSFTPGPANCTPTGTCALGTNWATSSATSQTAPNAAFHDAPSCVTDSSLDTPSIFIPVSVYPSVINFWHNYDLEGGHDGGVLEISIDGGAFTDIITAGGSIADGGYNGAISTAFLSPIAGRQAWTGNSGGYINTSASLPLAAIDHNVVLRFRLATDCSVAGTGWYVDSIAIAYYMSDATPTPTATATATSSPTPTATATASGTPAAQALNLSTRMRVETGDNVGIGGFIITGSAPKPVILRGIGPSLPVTGALADPILELHGPPGFVTIINDNWQDCSPSPPCTPPPLPPISNLESEIFATLDPGAYTAIVRGKDNTSGVALVEVYDLGQAAASKLANISTRAFVSTGSDIVIAGFILGNGGAMDNVILRGIGPSLAGFVPNPLANPTLELRDQNGALARANNDWQDDPDQGAIIIAAGLAPTHPLESGIATTLPPGLYTALLAGLNNGTGVGLVEVYDRGTP